jgi:Transposase DDE domain
MGRRAGAGTLWPTLVKLAIPVLKEAERQCPRTGPGAKPQVPDWVMAGLIMIGVLAKKKSKSAQFRFLSERRGEIAGWLGCSRFPSRARYFARYRQAHRLYRVAIRLQGEQAIDEGIADPKVVAMDKSLIEACGPAWHVQDRRAGKVPAGVDTDSSWGFSEHDGWVHGYSYEVIVSATAKTVVFPLLASVDTASASETRSSPEKIAELPADVQVVLADSGYDTNQLGEHVEFNNQGGRTGRRFVCPHNPRNDKRPKTKPGHADASRARSRELRRQRQKFFLSRRGRQLYARRRKTVEPFNQWFKSLFEMDDRVWHRGLDNNRTQIHAALFGYQLLVRFNRRCGQRNGCIKWILDAL